jgi:hypothetical protein
MSSIYKFSALDSYKLACLASDTMWFSNLDDFNDPFEGCVKITSDEKSVEELNTALKNIWSLLKTKGVVEGKDTEYQENYSEEEKLGLLKIINEIFETELQGIKQIAACSFMDAGDQVQINQHMWSHYADGLRGYCLRFNKKRLTDSLAIENEGYYLGSMNIKYSENIASIDAVEYFSCFDSRFNNSFIQQSLAPKLKIYSAVATKSSSWANEKEFRLLSGKKGSLKYDNEAIEEIIIGEKMPMDQQVLLIKIIQSINPSIKIKKVIMKKDSYLLKVVEYKR